ncbi:hypothetical protein N9Z47_00965 [bacterium]|nr:hypothetical protein [bacterium]
MLSPKSAHGPVFQSSPSRGDWGGGLFRAVFASSGDGCVFSRPLPYGSGLSLNGGLQMANLLMHCGGREVTRDDIANAPTPERTNTWGPVAHNRHKDVRMTMRYTHLRQVFMTLVQLG